MNSLLKMIPLSFILIFVSSALVNQGNKLKNRDADSVGKDDALGNVCIALSPVLMGITDISGNETAFRKGLVAVRDTINNYLLSPQNS